MSTSRVLNHAGCRLIRALRDLRGQSGYTQTEAAELLHFEMQKVSRLETNQLPSWHELQAILALYAVADRAPFEELYEAARRRGWWQKPGVYSLANCHYIAAEDSASAMVEFAPGGIPDLMQTEDYARVVSDQLLSGPDPMAADRRVTMISKRQEHVLIRSEPLVVNFLVYEPVLHQGVSRAQLSRLLAVSWLPNVTLQVVPQSVDLHAGIAGHMILLGFNDVGTSDRAFTTDLFSDFQEITHPDGIFRIGRALKHLAHLALSPEQSLSMIRKLQSG
ncbi:helix-turn-helix domain-containing protein [Actinocrispum wychmicini]|uniref:Helix-turn-helix protein n=1 Tax=Actinocrispum wychmicini TaxID=1213861 RepID=A0A4R2J567_9PSEU|nr:helix-turn-helix transcriptional regulator [Actinocrispum wychmicini]TCO53007.1 helix-turn-helix protein [Actinocrispum wychmicini]